MMKRVLSLLLLILLVFGMVPVTQTQAAGRTKINRIVATSTINSNTVRYGQPIFKPEFTITEGSPAYFADTMGAWYKKTDDGWKQVKRDLHEDRFKDGTYKFGIQVRTDDEGYVLADGAEVFVNGVQWSSISEPTIRDTYSYSNTSSPEYVIPEADPISGTVTIKESAVRVGEQITADISRINVTSPSSLEYQWQKSTDKQRWYDIEGATLQARRLEAELEGYYVRVKVTHPFYSSELYSDSRYVNANPTQYSITVINGKAKLGSGNDVTEASPGISIFLYAGAAPEGTIFDRWVVTGATVDDIYDFSTRFIMPANAVTATATFKRVIETVDVTITQPAVGKKPDFNPVLPSGANYELKSSSGMKWFDQTEEFYLGTTDSFQAGHVYSLRVDLIPVGDAEILSGVTGTLNGKTANLEIRDGEEYDTLRLSYVFPALSGWLKKDGRWYYYNSSGKTVTGWQKISGKWYYFNADGVMQTGWQKISGKWYYLESSGAMATGWKKINDKWYYLKSSGVMAASEWCGGYWLNSNGTWTYKYKGSWKHNSKGWWFGDESGWYAKNTTIRINDKNYTFNASGYWVE